MTQQRRRTDCSIENQRVCRFERLEGRQMLSADGLPFDFGRMNDIELFASDLGSREVSQANGRDVRPESPQSSLRVGSQPEGEFVSSANPSAVASGLQLSLVRVPVAVVPFFSSVPNQSSLPAPASLPAALPSLSIASLLGSRIGGNNSAEPTSSREVPNSVIDSALRELSSLQEEPTQTPMDVETPSDSNVSFVSALSRDPGVNGFSNQSTWEQFSTTTNLRSWEVGSLAINGIMDTPLDQWLSESQTLREELLDLERILDSIASEGSVSGVSHDAVITPSAAANRDGMPVSDTSLILLMPQDRSSGGLQELPQIDESSLNDWSVGIGFYRALQVMGVSEDGSALIDGDSQFVTPQSSLDAMPSHAEPISPTSQAVGVMFCFVGVQYLYKHQKRNSRLNIAQV
jgi:hypothetical protein